MRPVRGKQFNPEVSASFLKLIYSDLKEWINSLFCQFYMLKILVYEFSYI